MRSLFWQGLAGEAAQRQSLAVLQANFRNTRSVTELANTLLKIKQTRFGSIDRESNFLVQSASLHQGSVSLLAAKDAALRELDTRTRASVRHAVVVLRDEDKAGAREHFRTPLVFSVHEAKGLEYPHVILYSLVSGQRGAYAEVCNGVGLADLTVEELNFSRARDKGDKSLELYKFYVNALYVAMTRAVESLVLVESDTNHPLLNLLGLREVEASNIIAAPMQTSTREEWAQEARKLELQGKEEQARAVRNAFLQVKTVPWTPWTEDLLRELCPRALDPNQVSNKPRQILMDYALWHGQHAWIEQLSAKAHFQPASSLAPGDTYGQVKRTDFHGASPHDIKMLVARQKQLGFRAVEALRQRHLQPYTVHNFKELLRQCDTYGVDHPTPTGGTPLMMAARAGNLALVDALLTRGANVFQQDEFGHTAWTAALNRAIDDTDFCSHKIAPLCERIAPVVLDVQTDGRLVRLERNQGEYWVLSLMLAGFKTLRSRCAQRAQHPFKYDAGYFSEALQATMDALPEHLWKSQRRKRSYVNGVLARAEIQSQYQPSRKLWVRTKNGHYLPNPHMLLRTQDPETTGWCSVYETINLAWVDAGTNWSASWAQSLADLLDPKRQRASDEVF